MGSRSRGAVQFRRSGRRRLHSQGLFYRLFDALLLEDPPSDPETHNDHGPVYPPRLEPKTPHHTRRNGVRLNDFRSKNVTKEHTGQNIHAPG